MSSWLRCDCGHTLHTNLFAGAGVFMLIRDEDFDKLGESPDAAALRDLFVRSHVVYRCPQCGRLYVRWERGGEVTAYTPQPANTIDAPGDGPDAVRDGNER
jgi:hypothetical protein